MKTIIILVSVLMIFGCVLHRDKTTVVENTNNAVLDTNHVERVKFSQLTEAVQDSIRNTVVIDDTTSPDIEVVVNEPIYHVVKRGESLSLIAEKYYKDKTKWNLIYRLNKDNIDNPNLIYPAQLLRIN